MIHILIAEDEKPISNLIKLSLKNAGYLCDCAFDGGQAADLIESGNYDLILLDIMMPDIDGFELMEYIRPLEIPVIFIHLFACKINALFVFNAKIIFHYENIPHFFYQFFI